jgi:hypothetical protein
MKDYTKYQIKMIALILLFIFTVVALTAQKNTAYLSLSIPDRGLGFRYERILTVQPQTNSLAAYVGLTKGKYQMWYNRAINHVKIVGGLSYYVHTPGASYTNIFIAGLNYHFYSEKYLEQSVYFPVSFDIGTGMRIKRVSVLMTYDVLKKDASINIGYNF